MEGGERGKRGGRRRWEGWREVERVEGDERRVRDECG